MSCMLPTIMVQVCKSGMTNARKIWLTRHGESEYNQKALIGGDSPLSPNGQTYAELLPDVILSRLPKVHCLLLLSAVSHLPAAGTRSTGAVHPTAWLSAPNSSAPDACPAPSFPASPASTVGP